MHFHGQLMHFRRTTNFEMQHAFGLAYSFFRESNVAHFKMRHSTDTDSRLPIHQYTSYNSSKAVGLIVTPLPSIQHAL